MIQEFEISITAVGGDQYLVRTENVEKGVQLAEEKVRWPVDQWLEQTKSFMHDPLLGLLQGQQQPNLPTRAGRSTRQVRPESAQAETLVHLGQTLHDELFKGQLHDSWIMAQGVAQNRQDLLRLRIGMKDSRLQQLPWEALHAGARPLATGTDVIFSRYILDRRQGHSLPPLKPPKAGQSLRILMVIAAPDDQERLELKKEVYHLQAELHPEPSLDSHEPLLDVQLKILEQPGRAELTQELDRGNYQVLHYAGHSNLGNAGGDLYLVSRQTGLTERLSGEDLAGLLVNNGIKLAVFNSCRGGYSSTGDQGWQERNLAQALVNRGVPAVIAMTERIPDHVAITFTQLLYRSLKKGQTIDLSLNRTRQGLISAYGSHQFYWALPTLYMQPSFDGYLVKTAGDYEHSHTVDRANDPFGDMLFFEPGLAGDDYPEPRNGPGNWPDSLQKDSLQSKSSLQGQRLQSSSAAAGTGAAIGHSESVEADSLSTKPRPSKPSQASSATEPSIRKSVDYRDLADRDLVNDLVNSEEETAEAVLEPLSTTSRALEVDEALEVPEEIETPSGFYGEPANKLPAVPTLESPTIKEDAESASVLIGERLSRSHTLHTKLLTLPGIATVVLIGLFGVTTVSWLMRDGGAFQANRTPQLSDASTPSTYGDLGLPAQVEVALNQKNLDVATSAAQTLIEQGKLKEVIEALNTASPTQQQDPILAFFRGRAQWDLFKQGNDNYGSGDAVLSWSTALESEPDWMEINMALGFAHYETGRQDLALGSWEKAIKLAERKPDAQDFYFSKQSAEQYALNARAGVAIAALSLAKIETDPAERNALQAKAADAYRQVINEAQSEFSANALGNNWLWPTRAIADWERAKEELSQTIELDS